MTEEKGGVKIPIKSIADLSAGETFFTSYGEELVAKEVSYIPYPALFTECIPVPAVTVQGKFVKDRYFNIALAGLYKIVEK